MEVVYLGVALVSLCAVLLSSRRRRRSAMNEPPGPWQLPVIGSLHHLVGQLPHRAMRDLARRYGPVMLLRLGEVPTLVVSSREGAREVTKTHDLAFATRPLSATARVLTNGGRDIVFAPYGDHWRQVKKIAVFELLSARRVTSFRAIREEEVAAVLRDVAEAAAATRSVELRACLSALGIDITVRAVMGDRFKERDVFLHALDRSTKLVAGFNPPAQDLFSAGSETTTLEWAFAELMRNPKVMHKATTEVRRAFKAHGTVAEHRLDELPYMRLVIREALRLHMPTPLLLPRECREPCQVLGYDVPQGTQVLVNVWALGRDKRYWPDRPEEFRPERFKDEDAVDFKGNDFSFLPFGAGRRMCPGIAFGLANIGLALASLLFHFDWEGPSPDELDMTEAFGVTARRKAGLLLRPVLRVPVPFPESTPPAGNGDR
ncbi:zealexin A1 synthase-like [Triticum aestivum]|uniref:zealexin A1 synthase-like n=1 Tax=Triticum aestivum TaxID=4565 RepID=UPI001D01553A|nr:zealexin A1 synthase-like [Triticum aestivum]